MRSRWLHAVALFATVCVLSLPGGMIYAQDQLPPVAPVKPDRDAPFPLAASGVRAAAANLPDAVIGVEQWSKLAYQSFRDDNWEIYLAKGDGSEPVNLSQHRKADARPQLNAGATRVVFNSDRNGKAEIYVVNTDGSGLARLTDNKAADFAPVWSPDGQRIAFVSDRTGNNEIFVMNADGASPIQLTFDLAPDSSPAWSPDGQWLAWKRTNEGGSSAFMLMHPDGSGIKYLYNGVAFAGDLRWSPAGDAVVFDGDVDHDNWNELVQMRIVRGIWDYEVIFDANQPLVDAWAGSYAPDGRSFAFTLVQYVAYEGVLYLGRSDILNLNLSTGAISLFPGSSTEMNPSWMGEDTAAPQSQVAPLPEFVRFGRIPVRLEGADSGPSGVKNYDVQCALAADGPWSDVVSNASSAEPYLACGQLESTIWLRSRAKDYAGNVEAWPPAADTHTQYFSWAARGRAIDNRGVAAPSPAVTSEPRAFVTESNVGGGYRLLYTTEQTYTLRITAPGYGAALPTSLRLNADAKLDFFLPPVTDLIQNGSFEEELKGWTGDGKVVAGNLATAAHSGSHGLALGADCPLTCLTSALVPAANAIGQYKVLSDSHGNFHVVSGNSGDDGRLYYSVHSIDTGLWSEPEWLPPLPPATQYLGGFAMDGQGVLHVVVIAFDLDAKSWFTLWHTQKAYGVWTEFAKFGEGDREPLVIGDPIAGLHVLAANQYYYRLKPDGSWSPVIDINDGEVLYYPSQIAMTVTGDGIVHFFGYAKYAPMYRTLSPQGVLSERTEFSNEPFGEVRLAAGPQQTLHLLQAADYMHRGEDGVWTHRQAYTPETIYPTPRLFSDSAGRLHVFGRYIGTFFDYVVKTPDAGWLPPQTLKNVDVHPDNITVAANGIIQLLAVEGSSIDQFVYQSSPIGSTGTVTSATQVVTLPAQMVHPTLSFFHKAVSGEAAGQARLSVHVDDGLESTEVFSTPAAVGWTQGFVDMEPWLGKTVTVTFAVEQSDAEPLLSVYLDDISLGPWTTPVIHDVTPAQLYADWRGAQITVRGDNFTAGSSLRLGETALPATFVDEHTLQATIPARLAAGRYDLWVQNPDGQQTASAGGLTLGGWGYLPVMRK